MSEKLTKLPDAWALVGTEESRPILDKWLQENFNYKGSYGDYWSMFLYPNWNNHSEFLNGSHTVGNGHLHYNGHEGEIISLEDFKRLAFPVKELSEKELPEEYIVKCNSTDESVRVHSTYYNCNNIYTHWNYIVCRKDLISEGGSKGNSIEKYIRPEYSEMVVFTFEEWSKLINNKKEKEMKDFKITGSLALQQAFINETGIAYVEGEGLEKDFEKWPILTHYSNEKVFDSAGKTIDAEVTFELPKDWDKAVAFVKEWAKEGEEEDLFVPVKAGDLVMICKGEGNWGGSGMDKFVGKIVKVKTAESDESKIQIITFNLDDSNAWQWELKNKHYRKLTKDELKEFETIKPLKLGNYTGTIDIDTKLVYISGRGSLSFNTCIMLYNKFSPYTTPEGHQVVLNPATINIGCVKNIPVEDIISAVEYMEFMNLITL